MLPLVHVSAWRFASALLVAALVVATLMPASYVPLPEEGIDKVEHCAAYGLLALWFTGLVPRPRYAAVAVALAALGLALEFLQHAMHAGRVGDPRDVVANVLGLAIGVVLAFGWTGGWAVRFEAWLTSRRT